MIKFISLNRQGKEVILNFKIGNLHAYPNGDLRFEASYADYENDISRSEPRILKKQDN